MADFATLKAAIKALLVAQTSYFDADAVLTYEPEVGEVGKDPWCTLIPSGNANDYATTKENRRTYGFIIRVFVSRTSRTKAEAETLLENIVDDVVDVFDQNFTLSGAALYVSATPSAWGYIMGEQEYRTAEIRLEVKTDFLITT